MANPQLSEGYTRIAHKLLDALSTKTNDLDAIHVMIWVIRITYGYHQKIAASNYKTIKHLFPSDYTNEMIKNFLL